METTAESMADFAERVGVCVGTVKAWVAKGIPSFSAGRVRRILVEEGLAWLVAGGAEQRTARRAKSRGAGPLATEVRRAIG